jgi:type VI protein secretion system component VasK
MVVLGLLLLLAAAALVLLLVTAGTSQDVVLDLVGDQQLTTAPVWIFVAGMLTLVVAGLGWMLLVRGTRRSVARRKEMRRLRKAAAAPQVPVADDTSPQQESDRRLVRDVDSLHGRPAGGAAAAGSPEDRVDPEAGRHELRPEDPQARERGRQS